MSLIILDTSVVVPDFRLRSTRFRAVLHTAQELRTHINIPQLVIDELINKYREELQKSYDSMVQVEKKIRSLINSRLPERRIDISKQVALYSDWLQSEMSKNKIESIDYSHIDHKSLVGRALASWTKASKKPRRSSAWSKGSRPKSPSRSPTWRRFNSNSERRCWVSANSRRLWML
jgi:hypothetical protein